MKYPSCLRKAAAALVVLLAAGSTFAASCLENPYFPVVEGHSLTYSDGTRGEFMTQTITAIGAESFTVRLEMADLDEPVEAEYLCTEEGILAIDFGSLLGTLDADVDFDVISIEGTTFPNTWEVGHTWDSEIVMQMRMVVEGMEMDTLMTVSTTSTVVGFEDITVPAGDFSTVHIASNATATIAMSMMGMEIPLPGVETESDIYLAEGIGLVLNVSDDGDRMELLSYTTP